MSNAATATHTCSFTLCSLHPAWDHGKPMHQGVQLLRSSYASITEALFMAMMVPFQTIIQEGFSKEHEASVAASRDQLPQASSDSAEDSCVGRVHQSLQSRRGEQSRDHIGDPYLVMNPIPDNLKPSKAPIYQSGAGSPLRRATANIAGSDAVPTTCACYVRSLMLERTTHTSKLSF